MHFRWGIPVFFAASMLVACADNNVAVSKAFTVKNPFPAHETVTSLAKAPAQNLPARAVVRPVTWSVDLASVPAETTPAETRFAALDEHARAFTFRRDMRCLAGELARLYADQGAMPNERLQRFIEAACGASVSRVQFAAAFGQDDVTLSDEALLAQWRSHITIPKNPGKIAGLAVLRKGERSFIVLAVADDATHVDVTRGAEARRFRLSGSLQKPAALAIALVNRGTYNVAKCAPDASIALPAFSFTCEMAEGDATALVEIAAQEPGHVLLHSAARVLLRSDDHAPATFSAVKPAVDPTADLSQSILEAVNRTRAAAKIATVGDEPKQSATNQKLAGHYFASELTSDPAKADIVTLSLIAGWDVEGGMIRNGDFFGSIESGITDGASWVEGAIESPLGRFTLLDPDSKKIAIGAQKFEGGAGVAALVTTYQFYEDADHEADANELFSRLKAMREARHLPPLRRVLKIPELATQASLVNANKAEVAQALHDMMQSELSRTGLSIRGQVSAATRLDAIEIPPEFLTPQAFDVAIQVTHYRPEGMPWGVTLAFFLKEQAEQTTAQAPQRPQQHEAKPMLIAADARAIAATWRGVSDANGAIFPAF